VKEAGEWAHIILENSVEMPRTAADFQCAAFKTSSRFFWPPSSVPNFSVNFMHARPHNIEEYQRTFGQCALSFDAPWSGFTIPRSYLDQPIVSADPKLHALIRSHAEALLAGLPRAKSVTEKVREIAADELAGGSLNIGVVARKLNTTSRTLARRLEAEQTSFRLIVDDLRQKLAFRYVGYSELPLSEVAFLLGFSQLSAFHRALFDLVDYQLQLLTHGL
jgi:AraC-like DNA-binding protein